MLDSSPSGQPPAADARKKTSIATITPIVVLGILSAVTMLHYNRQMRLYTNLFATRNTTLTHNVSSVTEFHQNSFEIPDSQSPDELASTNEITTPPTNASFLRLETPSTRDARAWLNKSLIEGAGFMKFDHIEAAQERNTVTYRSCCGLGHRLTRLEDAAHVALLYNAALYIDWKDCGANTFQQIFGSEPFLLGQDETIEHDDPVSYRWIFGNDVPACNKLKQIYPEEKHACDNLEEGKIVSSPKLYRELMDRYIHREKIQTFVKDHFEGKLSIGMHVRAGNNETGDFTRKNRQIPDMNAFVKLNSDRVRNMMIAGTPTVLFIATDTASYIEAFRKELNDTMPVVEMEQPRAQDGSGVFFGEHGSPKPKGDECLDGWHAALQDMMILASTDIVFAPAYSSFTRTMPKVMALARPDRIAEDAFCEVWKQGKQVCYHSLQDFNAHPPPMKRRRQ